MLARPEGAAGAPGRGKLSGAVASILSLALDNNANGLFAQPQGIFDFGEFGEETRNLIRTEGGREREREGGKEDFDGKKPSEPDLEALVFSPLAFSLTLSFLDLHAPFNSMLQVTRELLPSTGPR